MDGVLGVGLRVVQLANIHRGLLRLVWGGGLERGKEPKATGETQRKARGEGGGPGTLPRPEGAQEVALHTETRKEHGSDRLSTEGTCLARRLPKFNPIGQPGAPLRVIPKYRARLGTSRCDPKTLKNSLKQAYTTEATDAF